MSDNDSLQGSSMSFDISRKHPIYVFLHAKNELRQSCENVIDYVEIFKVCYRRRRIQKNEFQHRKEILRGYNVNYMNFMLEEAYHSIIQNSHQSGDDPTGK